jgi:hypothetical protein
MNPATQQFLAAQMQLIQNLTTTIQNMQAQQNKPPPLAPNPPIDKHKEFQASSKQQMKLSQKLGRGFRSTS